MTYQHNAIERGIVQYRLEEITSINPGRDKVDMSSDFSNSQERQNVIVLKRTP